LSDWKMKQCYLYVDEAHSIGALGRTGRGTIHSQNWVYNVR
jgi:7-keto-8-aminopelargonate synthetase-like enzyme